MIKYKQLHKIFTILIITACLFSCERLDYFDRIIKINTGNFSIVLVHEAGVVGEFTDVGDLPILDYGHCWSKDETPDVGDDRTHLPSPDGPGKFLSELFELESSTTYYVRAYAITREDTVYGEIAGFTTWGLSDIDGNLYRSVIIGTQEWMAQNLRTRRYATGDEIPNGDGLGNISEHTNPLFYFAYQDDYQNAETYGLLYTWAAVMNGDPSSNEVPSDVQGVCPSGWHVPSDAEWALLNGFSGGETIAGGKLKEEGTEHWNNPNTGATNETGFAGLPGGYRDWSGYFLGLGEYGSYWTSTANSPESYFHWDLYYDASITYRNIDARHLGFSVRCVKD